MFNKILIPLDGSELSEVALPYAEALAGRLGSEIVLLFVNEATEDRYQHMHESYLEKMTEITKYGAETHLDKTGKKVIRVKPDILFGNPAEQIVNYVEKSNIDLVVMSTHGRSGISLWALGSVAGKVVRAANCPVALIRANVPLSEVRKRGIFDKVLVPLDGSIEGEQSIPYVNELATSLKTEVILFQVLSRGYPTAGYGLVSYSEHQLESDRVIAQAYLDKIDSQMKQQRVNVRSEIRFGNTAEEIIKFADELSVDMVAMSTHGRSGISRWALGSIAEKVLHEGNSPLLLVRTHQTSVLS